MECRKNRSDTRFYVPRLWDVWPLPLQQVEQDWDEVYVDEFPEVSDGFARPGDVRWDTSLNHPIRRGNRSRAGKEVPMFGKRT